MLDQITAPVKSVKPTVFIDAVVESTLHFAALQNSPSLFSSICLINSTPHSVFNITVELSFSPDFAIPKGFLVSQIEPFGQLELTDLFVHFDQNFWRNLGQNELGTACFRLLTDDGECIFEDFKKIDLLPRCHWGGFEAMGDLTASFVTSNDPALSSILQVASETLKKFGYPPALDGYRSEDPKLSYMLGASIWSAISAMGLLHTATPKNFVKNGQPVRLPSMIDNQGLVTPLDSSLLFASALEATGLNPLLLFTNTHCYCGFWLLDTGFSGAMEKDPLELRKALSARELIVFDPSFVSHWPAEPFPKAVIEAQKYLEENGEHSFVGAIDIAQARSYGIMPLEASNSSNPQPSEADDRQNANPLPLPKPPGYADLPIETIEVSTQSPKDRVARWQNKLLDLSLRNRLLNFKATKQTIPFFCADLSLLESQLTQNIKLQIKSFREKQRRGNTETKFDKIKARDALTRKELISSLEQAELSARTIELFRRAKSDINEGGTNTLFLAMGFLSWKRQADDEITYKAPLLLIPIKLERKSTTNRFSLEIHEDEVRFNDTLAEFLKRDFALQLPSFDKHLSNSEGTLDVPLILEMIRRVVRDISGFEVLEETALSTFSFAKYLMWQDMVARTKKLRQNRVVKHLIDNPDQAFESSSDTALPVASEIDRYYRPHDIVVPLPTDSSQLTAVMAAHEGKDFILVGPPGTGKSQTITNIIAQCLSHGKTVLFVAEKTAALDVVYRRLKENGLGNHCLELHSNKADRKQFLSQLKTAWDNTPPYDDEDWSLINEHLEIHRDHLNEYVETLHQKAPNGLSVFRALGLSIKNADKALPKLDWEEDRTHSEAGMRLLRSIITDIARVHKHVTPIPALEYISITDWSVRWQEELLNRSRDLHEVTVNLEKFCLQFREASGVSQSTGLHRSGLQRLSQFAQAISSLNGENFSLIFEADFPALYKSAGSLEEQISRYRRAEQRLAAAYLAIDIPAIPIQQLLQDWKQATAKMWPLSSSAKAKVRKRLEAFASSQRAVELEDLDHLLIMQQTISVLDQHPLKPLYSEWRGVDTDLGQLSDYLSKAAHLRSQILNLGIPETGRAGLKNRLLEYFSNHPLRSAINEKATEFHSCYMLFQDRLEVFCRFAGPALLNCEEPDFIAVLKDTLAELARNKSELQVWTEWCSVKEQALNHGLSPFIQAVENGWVSHDKLQESFEAAYANWWLPTAIDRTPALRKFKRFNHEELLQEFRRLDEQVRAMSASKVQQAMGHNLPLIHEVAKSSELGHLRHQMGLKRPSKSIRDMISGMPSTFSQLAPCLLMSPLSISQYLPVDHAQFDVVIFDEASQITTWDAVGAIARARQTIIVGDPKQLPPTNFFGRNEEEGEEELEAHERDLESILEEAKASGLPQLQLNWHYRSRHESLIAFSNWHYYGNKLITFPSPVTTDNAVRLVHNPEAFYDRGKSRTNPTEAREVVKAASERLRSWLTLPQNERPSLGIITFNQKQQDLIQDLLDAELRSSPELEWYFLEEREEPVIVRNLENVQGEERDIFIFSITFAPDQAGKLSMSFGALNQEGGERRLNVAITRAREELVIYSGITADNIDLSRTRALGVRHLKAFLDYAQKGAKALPATVSGSMGGYDSPFEEAVASTLEKLGWTVVPQVGVSGFRIDLGVVHPTKPGAFLAGIECDGATYHRSATARDRDKVREQVLRNLGWEILRIWSPDWWYDSEKTAQRIHSTLTELLQCSEVSQAFEQG
ncbi:DUF4011 domain-containing protein [Flexibacterium corallicola]|uniref:DUF4011 domain-containing protein n=1 Tax=Flexibacterium corallicola TaxID=3037259 RepID=UPI00286F495D|nr:DUF4011 domain-containing protein [Pseudovibrio sp. M1P-2-3]